MKTKIITLKNTSIILYLKIHAGTIRKGGVNQYAAFAGLYECGMLPLEKKGKYEIRREDSPTADLRYSLFHLNEAGDEQRQVDDQQKDDDQADQIRHDGL